MKNKSNLKYCSVCGREKEKKHLDNIPVDLYIECECEQKIREENEKKLQIQAESYYFNSRATDSHIMFKERNAFFNNMIIDESNEKVVKLSKFIAEMLINNTETESDKNGMVLFGNTGSGKTYISSAIINEYNKNAPINEGLLNIIKKNIANGVTPTDIPIKSKCKIIKERDLIKLSDIYNYKTDSSPVDEYVKADKLLIIDDVGTFYGDKNKASSTLFYVIDYRYSQKLPTIITTNLNKEELSTYLSDRSFDRLSACCWFMALKSEKSRRK